MAADRSVVLLISAIGMLASMPTCANAVWGVIMDMGSSGTRARIYTWEEGARMREFEPEDSADSDALEISPGIAEVPPESVGTYLRPLLTQAARWVPADEAPNARVRAFATAGMRALVSSEQEAIWAAVRAVLGDVSASPFLFDPVDATTISGNLEGLFGFLAVNFILEETSRDHLVGAMDLGGASMELAFAPDGGAPIMADAYRATANGRATMVYSHSYMNSGQQVARSRLAEHLLRTHAAAQVSPVPNPCLSVGFLDNYTTTSGANVQFIGGGDYDECFALMGELLHPDYECLQQPCAAMGVYQPALPSGRHSLVAYSAFFYTVNGIGLLNWTDTSGVGGVPDITPHDIMEAGRRWCSRPWSEVRRRYADMYCFSSAYIPAMLKTFGVDSDSNQIMYTHQLGDFKVEWALGAQLFYAEEDSHSYALSSDQSGVASSCVRPDGAGKMDDTSSSFGVGTLVGLCFLNLVIGATLGQLCKMKQPAAKAFGGASSDEGIYAGGTS